MSAHGSNRNEGPKVVELEQATGKRLLLPEARSLAEVATVLGPYESGSDFGAGGANVEGNTLSQYASLDLSQLGGPRHAALRLEPTPATLAALRGQLVTPDDTLSWKIIGHKSSGLALVLVQHGYIIGSRWLAYVDPATIPLGREANRLLAERAS